jgi:S-formylglutathione hydrolase FrmB
MRHLSSKVMACVAIMLMCCLSCNANTGSSSSASSSEVAPKVKTTKKSAAKAVPQEEQANVDNPQINLVTVKSEKMGRDIKNLVIVPKTVVDGDKTTYPVLYLLHGYGGCHTDWQAHIDLTKLADEYKVIFVCPDGQNAWYFDSPVNSKSQYETYVTQELREWVEANYPTINDAKHRAITGLSMGGHGSLWLGWRHPELYGSCGSMSGAVDIMTLKDRFELDKVLGKYAQNAESWKSHSVINLVPTLKDGQQNIIIDDGAQDFLIKENRALHAALQQKGITHNYSERPGKHAWNYWVVSLKHHLDFFSRYFKD